MISTLKNVNFEKNGRQNGRQSPPMFDDSELSGRQSPLMFGDSELSGIEFDTANASDTDSIAQEMFLTLNGELDSIEWDKYPLEDPSVEPTDFSTIDFDTNMERSTSIKPVDEDAAAAVIQSAWIAYQYRRASNGADFIGNIMDSDSEEEPVDSEEVETESEDESENDSEDDTDLISLERQCNTCETPKLDLDEEGNCIKCVEKIERANARREREAREMEERRRRLANQVEDSRLAKQAEKRSLKRSRDTYKTKTFTCHGCDRTFSSNQMLRIHIMGHGTDSTRPGHGAMDDYDRQLGRLTGRHPLRILHNIPDDYDHLYNKCTHPDCLGKFDGFLQGGINRKWLKRHYKKVHNSEIQQAPKEKARNSPWKRRRTTGPVAVV